MKKTILFLTALLTAMALDVFAGNAAQGKPVPKFEDHSVTVSEPSQRVEVDLKSDPYAEMYKKYITKAARKNRPNFAGHYILTKWECGTNCRMFGIVDSTTGKVFIPPFSLSDWKSGPLDFKADSKLLIVNGVINQTGPVTTFYYLWDGGRLKLLTSN